MLLLGDLVTAISVELVRHLQHPERKRPHPISAERGAMQQGLSFPRNPPFILTYIKEAAAEIAMFFTTRNDAAVKLGFC
tara:strand:- start:931 stop:1167 length:237 start_codon:yes stop_codon:yes gene_type:complete